MRTCALQCTTSRRFLQRLSFGYHNGINHRDPPERAADKKAAAEGFRSFTSALDRAVKANVIHRNAAARQKSHLAKRLGAKS